MFEEMEWRVYLRWTVYEGTAKQSFLVEQDGKISPGLIAAAQKANYINDYPRVLSGYRDKRGIWRPATAVDARRGFTAAGQPVFAVWVSPHALGKDQDTAQ